MLMMKDNPSPDSEEAFAQPLSGDDAFQPPVML